MAYTCRPDVKETLTVERFLDLADDFDLSTPELVLRIAPLFAALNANPSLLLPHISRILADPAAPGVQTDYSGQTFVLADAPRFFLRANVWLPETYDMLREFATSGQFFYGTPHDHNFTFLTACHRGSGYRTEIFEHDGIGRTPAVGDFVETTFLEERVLHEGMLMVYRASRDIHIQYPPRDFSVTINLMTKNAAEQVRHQNLFDPAVTRVVEQPRGVDIAKRQLENVLAAVGA
jgi:hypothetical protein